MIFEAVYIAQLHSATDAVVAEARQEAEEAVAKLRVAQAVAIDIISRSGGDADALRREFGVPAEASVADLKSGASFALESEIRARFQQEVGAAIGWADSGRQTRSAIIERHGIRVPSGRTGASLGGVGSEWRNATALRVLVYSTDDWKGREDEDGNIIGPGEFVVEECRAFNEGRCAGDHVRVSPAELGLNPADAQFREAAPGDGLDLVVRPRSDAFEAVTAAARRKYFIPDLDH